MPKYDIITLHIGRYLGKLFFFLLLIEVIVCSSVLDAIILSSKYTWLLFRQKMPNEKKMNIYPTRCVPIIFHCTRIFFVRTFSRKIENVHKVEGSLFLFFSLVFCNFFSTIDTDGSRFAV